jgi:hypothetical protein
VPIAPDGTPLPYPDQGGGGLPPELMALLGGGGQPPSEEESAPELPSGPDAIRQMIELAGSYQSSEQDEEDLLAIEKARTILQQLLAKQQKEQDGLLQGKATPGALRRATRG